MTGDRNPQPFLQGNAFPLEPTAARKSAQAGSSGLRRRSFWIPGVGPEDYRLPECYSGHPRDVEHPFPALYPKTNWPQAWSASSVFSILQAILGVYPFAPTKLLLLDPHLPDWLPEITLRNLHVGRAPTSIRFYREGKRTHFDVLEKRGHLHVLRQPSPWSLTAGFAERIKDVMESLIP